MNEYFYKLTPQVIIDSVESNDFVTTGLCWKLNSLENRVYDLELEDKSHVVVKFYRPGRWTKDQILEEHDFLFDLQENEIPVCAPIKFKDNSSLKEIEGIYYAIWPRTGGRCIDEFSDAHLSQLGRLLGRIHQAGKLKKTKYRLNLDAVTLAQKPLSFLQNNKIIPSSCEKKYIDAVNTICSIFDELIKGVPFHRIHGDCHIGNLLFRDNQFFFLDFDDFCNGPAIQDFWMIASNSDSEGLKKLYILIENYSTFCDFEESWLNLIEPLRTLRFIHYAGWIAKRWDDPSFKNAFPHFGSEEYWLSGTKDLEEQIKTIENTSKIIINNSIQIDSSDNEEPELTNKELFWDWEE